MAAARRKVRKGGKGGTVISVEENRASLRGNAVATLPNPEGESFDEGGGDTEREKKVARDRTKGVSEQREKPQRGLRMLQERTSLD